MEFVILKTIFLLAILILPLFGPRKKKKRVGEKEIAQKHPADAAISDYSINEYGDLEKCKKKNIN